MVNKHLRVVRSLLRHLKTELPKDFAQKAFPASANAAAAVAPTTTRSFVLQQYRAYQHVDVGSEEASRLRQLASDFLALRKDLKERDRLYALDASAETEFSPREMSRRAAARAGLQLPDLDPNLT